MADGTNGPPPGELGIPPQDLGIKTPSDPTRPQEFGRIDLQETPYRVDVRALQTQYFPEGKYLKIADGSEYVLDANGRTIVLFEKPTDNGFTSAYSPLTPQVLRQQISRLPIEQQQQLAQVLHLPDIDVQSIASAAAGNYRLDDLQGFIRGTRALGREIQPPERSVSTPSKRDLPLPDLPDNHFVKLTNEQSQTRKAEQWEAVRDLPDDDTRKILYYRRFPDEFHSAPISPELRNALHGTLAYYGVDVARMSELPTVEPYRPAIEVPVGRKIGFVIGYHHLEKPWGRIFMEMIQRQVQYQPEQIEFIVIQNQAIPTGDPSPQSEREIREAVASRGITDIIDVHEQLSTLNHYMDYNSASEFNATFRQDRGKNPTGGEYTLDPTVPLWAIEQYYQGNTYPQLQYAINEQIKKAEILIKSFQK